MSDRPIWRVPVDVARAQALCADTLVQNLGIEFLEFGPDFIRARMPVDGRTRQPAGLLHGGASLALAETLGSLGAHLCEESGGRHCVGLEINANHVRAVRSGWVEGTARPLHRGSSTQIWETRIHDDRHRLVCVSRLTLALLDRSPGAEQV